MNRYFMIYCSLISLQVIHGAERKWDAQYYKENSSLQYKAAQAILSPIIFDQNATILDVGCGDGKITYDIAQKVPQGSVLGIDFSHDMIEKACTDHADQKNLSFEQADVVTFKSAQQFNYAFAFCSLSWVKNQQSAYKSIANALQEGGKFVAIVSDEDSFILQAYRKTFALERWKRYFENYIPSYYPSKKETVNDYMQQAGFTSIVVENAQFPPIIMSKDMMIKALAATPGAKDAVPQEYYNDFLNDVMEEYLRLVSANADETINVDMGLLLLQGQKSAEQN